MLTCKFPLLMRENLLESALTLPAAHLAMFHRHITVQVVHFDSACVLDRLGTPTLLNSDSGLCGRNLPPIISFQAHRVYDFAQKAGWQALTLNIVARQLVDSHCGGQAMVSLSIHRVNCVCRFVVSPNLTITGSERTVGPDIVYVYRCVL